jgi:hypothetical protein
MTTTEIRSDELGACAGKVSQAMLVSDTSFLSGLTGLSGLTRRHRNGVEIEAIAAPLHGRRRA